MSSSTERGYLFGTKLPLRRTGIIFRPKIGHNLRQKMDNNSLSMTFRVPYGPTKIDTWALQHFQNGEGLGYFTPDQLELLSKLFHSTAVQKRAESAQEMRQAEAAKKRAQREAEAAKKKELQAELRAKRAAERQAEQEAARAEKAAALLAARAEKAAKKEAEKAEKAAKRAAARLLFQEDIKRSNEACKDAPEFVQMFRRTNPGALIHWLKLNGNFLLKRRLSIPVAKTIALMTGTLQNAALWDCEFQDTFSWWASRFAARDIEVQSKLAQMAADRAARAAAPPPLAAMECDTNEAGLADPMEAFKFL